LVKNRKKLVLATDYSGIFDNRMVIITGMSRSGTSILGKIVGSMEGAIYIFEPVIMRLLPAMAKTGHMDFGSASQLLKGILFEDYYLQSLHGRNVNFKESDNSFIGNYQDIAAVKERWVKYERREGVLEDIYKGKYTFLMKINEIHPLLPLLGKMFKGLRVIHIIRNCNAVISSSMKRGWYTDEFLNRNMTQWMRAGAPKAPWFVPKEDIIKFREWNRETRIAYAWRLLGKMAIDYGRGRDNYLEIKYEDLVRDPSRVASSCERFLNSKKTKITARHIKAVKEHVVTRHSDTTINIDSKERPYFERFMKELGYL